MTERLSDERLQKIEWFDKNYVDIKKRVEAACKKRGRSADEVILLAATKTVPAEVINHAIESGIAYIGENRVQEFLSKEEELKTEAHRHFIGHLQTNKVKDIVGKVEMIQSVHSIKLATEINKASQKLGIKTDILVEVNIGNEESKSGFAPAEVYEAVEQMAKMPFIKVNGLMTIPPICEKTEECVQYFDKMSKLFIDIRHKKVDNVSMEYLSMGMSDDFELAIEYGANIIRVGTALFGRRNYL